MYLSCAPVDMRKGFNGLAAQVATIIKMDPFCGHLFVFRGKRGDYVKVLYWDGSGLCLYAKRLEKGRFRLPRLEPESTSVALSSADLAMLMSGIDWTRARRQKLHEPPKPLANFSGQKIDKRPEV